VILIDPQDSSGTIGSLSQAFRNGELWGINLNILAQGSSRNPPLIPSRPMESLFYNSIRQYSAFLQTIGRVAPPYTVEAGIVGVKDWTLVISDQSGAQYLGQMYQGEVLIRRILSEMTDATMDSFLLTFFEKVYDQTGYPRPTGLYGFPGPRPYPR
jgi:hypothetical protein